MYIITVHVGNSLHKRKIRALFTSPIDASTDPERIVPKNTMTDSSSPFGHIECFRSLHHSVIILPQSWTQSMSCLTIARFIQATLYSMPGTYDPEYHRIFLQTRSLQTTRVFHYDQQQIHYSIQGSCRVLFLELNSNGLPVNIVV